MSYNTKFEEQLEKAVIEKNDLTMQFVSYNKNNKQNFGIVLDKIQFDTPISVIMPLFNKNQNNEFSLMTNSINEVIQDLEISKIYDKKEGLNVWKELIKETGSDPNLEINSKMNNFISPKVNNSLKSDSFSLTKTFDECVNTHKQILSQVESNPPLEKIFDKMVNEMVNQTSTLKRKSLLKEKETSKITTINQLQSQKMDMRDILISILTEINSENLKKDIEFVNNFKFKFEKEGVTQENSKEFRSNYEKLSEGFRASEMINTFVEKHKSEILSKLNIQINPNEINKTINKREVIKNEFFGIEKNDKFYYGKVLNVDEQNNEITIDTGKNKPLLITLEENTLIYKMFAQQQLIEQHIARKLNEEKSLLNWNDLSFENQLRLLKGQNSSLIKGVDTKTGEEIEFKIYAFPTNVDTLDNELKLVTLKNNKDVNFDLEKFEFAGKKLKKDEIEKLSKNEIIVFEVFDKNGTLQFTHDMKYDKELNDIVVSPNKGINYARNLKEGKEKGFSAQTRIEKKGNTPKF